MSSRPTPSALSPAVETDCEDLSEADRVALEEAEAAVARGEWVTHEVAMAKLDAMRRKFQALAASRR